MNLHDLLVDELKDLYHAEKQLTKALPKMAKAATHEGLRDALESHLEETREHVARLEEAFGALDMSPKAKPCAGMAGIIEEGSDLLEEDAEPGVLDAGIIAAAQRAEHYEIGAYGTCAEWARLLGLDEVVSLLERTLNEEKAADQKLTALAESGINEAAAGGESEEDEASEGTEAVPASRARGSNERKQTTASTRSRSHAADRRR